MAAAQAVVDKYRTPPDRIPPETPLSATPAPGKEIVWLRCPQPSCIEIGEGIEEAAGLLGWSVQTIDYGANPASAVEAFNQALRTSPDGIALSGIPSSVYEQALAAAKKAGVPVVTGSVIDKVGGADGNGIYGLVSGPDHYKRMAKALANWIIADSNGDAHVALFTIQDYPILRAEQAAFEAEMKRSCPGCKVTVVNSQISDVGTRLPSLVSAAVQREPSITHVAFTFGALSRGVQPALAVAGSDAKVVGAFPTEANLAALQSGEEAAWVTHSSFMVGYGYIDTFARFFLGDSLAGREKLERPVVIYTADSPPPNTAPRFPKDYTQQYQKMWNVAQGTGTER